MPSPFWALHADRRPFLLGRTRIMPRRCGISSRRGISSRSRPRAGALAGERDPSPCLCDRARRRRRAARERLYLRTSPEFACKKLLAAGERRIVEFARSFRNRERGALHHPEFTLIEWYRAHEPYEALMEDCAAILALAADGGGHAAVLVSRPRH